MRKKLRSYFSLIGKFTPIFLLAWTLGLLGSSPSHSLAEGAGKPFFPIGIYSVNPPAVFPEIKGAGFNTVQTYEAGCEYLRGYLAAAQKNGLKVLIYPGGVLGKAGVDPGLIGRTVGPLGKSPALLAWYLCDEPDTMGIATGALRELYGLVKSFDPHHPCAGAVWKPQYYSRFAGSYDIFMVDPYPIPKEPLTMVSTRIDLARKAVGDNHKIWAILQAFGYQNEHSNGWGWKREPTEAELRAMTWLAVVHGVQGIFYYTYHGSRYFIEDSPGLWESLKRVVRELNDNYFLLTSSVSKEAPFRVNGKVHYCVRKIEHGAGKTGAGAFLISVNTSPLPQQATYVLSGAFASIKELAQIDAPHTIEIRKGYFPDSMEPFAVKIYKLQGDPIHGTRADISYHPLSQ